MTGSRREEIERRAFKSDLDPRERMEQIKRNMAVHEIVAGKVKDPAKRRKIFRKYKQKLPEKYNLFSRKHFLRGPGAPNSNPPDEGPK